MFNKIQTLFSFSDYQIAQLKYLFFTFLSESSKLIILGLIFKNNFISFLYSIMLFSVLRLTTGGLHCASYIGCLITTFFFLFISIYILPSVKLSIFAMSLLLSICILINFTIGPISSSKRLSLNSRTKKRLAYQSVFVIGLHLILLLYFKSNLLIIGSWLIILHTSQLIIASSKKEVNS